MPSRGRRPDAHDWSAPRTADADHSTSARKHGRCFTEADIARSRWREDLEGSRCSACTRGRLSGNCLNDFFEIALDKLPHEVTPATATNATPDQLRTSRLDRRQIYVRVKKCLATNHRRRPVATTCCARQPTLGLTFRCDLGSHWREPGSAGLFGGPLRIQGRPMPLLTSRSPMGSTNCSPCQRASH